MVTNNINEPISPALASLSFEEIVSRLKTQIRTLYLGDDLPWVVGYSGGKDSTATLQLVWRAIAQLPQDKRTKPIHVISTDTLVENPIIAKWVEHSLQLMNSAAVAQNIPVIPHRLVPALQDRFWVNLIGRGYPAPRPKFRWCTSRLKINPSNKFIREIADENGEAILVLGSRKAESSARKSVLQYYEKSTRELLSRNSNPMLDRVWVYTPIQDWSSDEVWAYLGEEIDNPWGRSNDQLFEIYRGATPDRECPLVVDSSTPSCGDSRFGCFVCTLVDKDKSMQAMIQNDEQKRWMLPLSEFRNVYLDVNEDRAHRDFRRMDRSLTVHNNRLVHGPYTQRYRQELLQQLLKAQKAVHETGPEHARDFEIISLEELEEIRRIWVKEKHEFEDSLPKIYEEVLRQPYPGNSDFDEGQAIRPEDIEILRGVAASEDDPYELHFQLVRELMHIEQGYRTASRRTGIYDALEKTLEGYAFDNEQEAYEFAVEKERMIPSKNRTASRVEDSSVSSETGDLFGSTS